MNVPLPAGVDEGDDGRIGDIVAVQVAKRDTGADQAGFHPLRRTRAIPDRSRPSRNRIGVSSSPSSGSW